MRVVCAWCKLDMGTKFGPENLTTHGICKDCKDEIDNKLREDDGNLGAWIDYVNDTTGEEI